MKVRLDASEYEYAVSIGRSRQARNARAGRRDKAPGTLGKTTPEDAHIVGAIGEAGVAKALGVDWIEAKIRTPGKRADVAGYEVRATRHAHHPHLPIRKADHYPVVLVVVSGADVEIVGWYPPDRARLRDDWRDQDPYRLESWWIPSAELFPIGELPARRHLHGWIRDALGDWLCLACRERFVGPVPVCERHPAGIQEAIAA